MKSRFNQFSVKHCNKNLDLSLVSLHDLPQATTFMKSRFNLFSMKHCIKNLSWATISLISDHLCEIPFQSVLSQTLYLESFINALSLSATILVLKNPVCRISSLSNTAWPRDSRKRPSPSYLSKRPRFLSPRLLTYETFIQGISQNVWSS